VTPAHPGPGRKGHPASAELPGLRRLVSPRQYGLEHPLLQLRRVLIRE